MGIGADAHFICVIRRTTHIAGGAGIGLLSSMGGDCGFGGPRNPPPPACALSCHVARQGSEHNHREAEREDDQPGMELTLLSVRRPIHQQNGPQTLIRRPNKWGETEASRSSKTYQHPHEYLGDPERCVWRRTTRVQLPPRRQPETEHDCPSKRGSCK